MNPNSPSRRLGAQRASLDHASILPDLPRGSRVLLIRLRSLGDIVLLTPSLRLLKSWRPDLHVSVAVEERFCALLRGNPSVDEVLALSGAKGWRRAKHQVRTVRELRRKKFALAVNLHGGPASVFLTRFSKARWKVGFAHFRSRRIYSFLVPDARAILNQDTVHTAEHHAAALFWLGLPRQAVPPAELYVSENAREGWTNQAVRLGLKPGQGYALMHPAALYSTKQWPADRFAELGHYVEEETGLAPVFSCGPGESWTLDDVESAFGRSIRRVEAPGLDQFMAAIAGCRLFIGNDSGPAHMAAALGRPLVVIFGSSNSKLWRPWAGSEVFQRSIPDHAKDNFRVVQNSFECNPCPGDRCYRYDRPECILSVRMDQVKDAVHSIFKTIREVNQIAATDESESR
ncbi:MAG TPA: glycosyltransferase family 9 protein [Terriglobia bacterium]|nr:glycosyltransferase family 9 protein [Terriglobia bacterium]